MEKEKIRTLKLVEEFKEGENFVKTEEEEALVEVLKKLKDFDAKDIVERVGILLDARLKNEIVIGEALKQGVERGFIKVEAAAKLLARSKDSVNDLAKVKQLLEGKPTERVGLTVEEEEELAFIRRRFTNKN